MGAVSKKIFVAHLFCRDRVYVFPATAIVEYEIRK